MHHASAVFLGGLVETHGSLSRTCDTKTCHHVKDSQTLLSRPEADPAFLSTTYAHSGAEIPLHALVYASKSSIKHKAARGHSLRDSLLSCKSREVWSAFSIIPTKQIVIAGPALKPSDHRPGNHCLRKIVRKNEQIRSDAASHTNAALAWARLVTNLC